MHLRQIFNSVGGTANFVLAFRFESLNDFGISKSGAIESMLLVVYHL